MRDLSERMKDPKYHGTPIEELIRIKHLVDLEEKKLGVDIPISPEALCDDPFHPFEASRYLEHMKVVGRFDLLVSSIASDPYTDRRPPILGPGAGSRVHIACEGDRKTSRKGGERTRTLVETHKTTGG